MIDNLGFLNDDLGVFILVKMYVRLSYDELSGIIHRLRLNTFYLTCKQYASAYVSTKSNVIYQDDVVRRVLLQFTVREKAKRRRKRQRLILHDFHAQMDEKICSKFIASVV